MGHGGLKDKPVVFEQELSVPVRDGKGVIPVMEPLDVNFPDQVTPFLDGGNMRFQAFAFVGRLTVGDIDPFNKDDESPVKPDGQVHDIGRGEGQLPEVYSLFERPPGKKTGKRQDAEKDKEAGKRSFGSAEKSMRHGVLIDKNRQYCIRILARERKLSVERNERRRRGGQVPKWALQVWIYFSRETF